MKKNMMFYLTVCMFVCIIGCNSLPEGEPPEGNIVAFTNIRKHIYSSDSAVNYMLLALQTECPVIANAVIPPVMIKEFPAYKNSLFIAMQSALWNKLRKSKMIIPGGQFFSVTGTYILAGKIEKLTKAETHYYVKGKSRSKEIFKWTLIVKKRRNNSSAVIWDKTILFILPKSLK